MSAPETAMCVVTLRPVIRANYEAVIALQVRADQRGFVAPNVFSIAQHHFFPGSQIRAIYAAETLVGFVMWGIDEEDNPSEMWLWRLMIDAAGVRARRAPAGDRSGAR